MTRSNNSRRGCISYDVWDKRYYKREQRKKQNSKKNRIKFDGITFTHKRKHKTIKKEHNILKGWEDHFHEKYIIPAKKSYRDWAWLKGKPNEKGWCPSKYWTYINGRYSNTYSRCQKLFFSFIY